MPNDELLSAVLADSKLLWDGIKNHVAAMYGNMVEEWKFYGVKSGWTLAVICGKRRLVNLVPVQAGFRAVFTLSEKAAGALQSSDLSDAVKALLPDEAACVCGYGITLDVKTNDDLDPVKKLLEIKNEN